MRPIGKVLPPWPELTHKQRRQLMDNQLQLRQARTEGNHEMIDWLKKQRQSIAASVDIQSYLGWFRRHAAPTPEDAYDRFLGSLLDATIGEAPQRLRHPNLLTHESTLERHYKADYTGVDYRMQRFTGALILAAAKKGIPLYCHQARRTPSQQKALYDKKRSKNPGPIAPHVYGCASDIVHAKYHWQLTHNEWAYIGIIGKQLAHKMGLQVDWGGDWSFYDPAHWQLTRWKYMGYATPTNEPPTRLTPKALVMKTQGLSMAYPASKK